MEQIDLSSYFNSFIQQKPLFRNKKSLQLNYTPENIPHRQDQINFIAKVLAPILRKEKPSNVFLYGKTGTGKTLSVKYITNQILNTSSTNNIPLKIIYLNCKLKKVADTEYRLIAQLARDFGKDIPSTGLPTDEVYKIFYSALETENINVILVLDEIDQLVRKTGDEILYNLTRINEELKSTQLTIVGISNDMFFLDHIDPRVRSSLSEEELLFPPYNAIQLQDILRERCSQAFDKDIVSPGVIEKCAAYSARDHGDARRALELMRVAAELAERENAHTISLAHLDKAEDKIENDRVLEIVQAQTKQFQAALYSIIKLSSRPHIFTGEIYELYKSLCEKVNLRPLTQRRVSDVIAELDMLGIVNAKVISKGRYGRTREISLPLSQSIIAKIKTILEEGLAMN